MKQLLVFLAIILALVIWPVPALAHVLMTDGDIGVVLHIDPDDDPVVGQPSYLFFDVTDKTNRFKASQCDCSVQIVENGQSLSSTQVLPSDPTKQASSLMLNYTFPSRDVYKIRLIGNPISGGNFQPFQIDFDVRVAREVLSPSVGIKSSNWFLDHLTILILGTIMLGLVSVGVIKKLKNND